MRQALKLDALRKLMIFFLVFLLIMPNFKDYLDYFYNFSTVWDATLEIIVSTGVLISTIVYAVLLEQVEIRRIAAVAIVFYLLNTVLNILLVNQVVRLNTFPFVSIQAILFEAPCQALFFLPAYVTVAKLIPDDVEASMYSILKSIQACSVLVYGRLLGSAIGAAISRKPTDTTHPAFLTALLCTALIAGSTLSCFLRLLPTQVEILAAQTSIFYEHFMKKKEADRTRIDLNRIATFA
jgi:Na+/melibiose symporter-like transporter